MANRPMLEVVALEKRFGTTTVLKKIDLRVAEGELVFVIGPSGSGKSTMLRCCNRLEEPTSGDIIVNGRNIMAGTRRDLDRMRLQIGMVFQGFHLYPHMSVRKNLSFGLKMKGESKEVIEQSTNEVAKILEIDELLDRLPKQLSGGQAQRVALGRALIKTLSGTVDLLASDQILPTHPPESLPTGTVA